MTNINIVINVYNNKEEVRDKVIYRHVTLGKRSKTFYIGIGSEERAYWQHGRSLFWNRVSSKYGYHVEILKRDLTFEEAKELEILLIAHYGRRDNNTGILVNLTDGGDGCVGILKTKESIELWRESRKWYTTSQETKNKMSTSHKGKPKTVEHARNNALARTGTKRGEVAIANLKKSHIGRDYTNMKKINSELKSKKVINTLTGEVYSSLKEAAVFVGIPKGTLGDYLRGRYKNKTTLKYLEI